MKLPMGRETPRGANACPNCGNPVRTTRDGNPHRCRRASCRHLPRAACIVEGCGRPRESATLCTGHNNQKSRGRQLRALRPKRSSASLSIRDADGRKYCQDCDSWLEVAMFRTTAQFSDGLDLRCRPCNALISRMRNYRISVAHYRQMLAEQGGKCAICQKPPEPGRLLVVDHRHSCCPEKSKSCGECIRGLLCQTCNAAIGMFNENVETLRRAAAYAQGTPATKLEAFS